MTQQRGSQRADVVVLGLWHENELVVSQANRLNWYVAMRHAAAADGTWREFLAVVATVDETQEQLLRELYEPELDEAFDGLPDTWDGLPWPGLPAEETPP